MKPRFLSLVLVLLFSQLAFAQLDSFVFRHKDGLAFQPGHANAQSVPWSSVSLDDDPTNPRFTVEVHPVTGAEELVLLRDCSTLRLEAHAAFEFSLPAGTNAHLWIMRDFDHSLPPDHPDQVAPLRSEDPQLPGKLKPYSAIGRGWTLSNQPAGSRYLICMWFTHKDAGGLDGTTIQLENGARSATEFSGWGK